MSCIETGEPLHFTRETSAAILYHRIVRGGHILSPQGEDHFVRAVLIISCSGVRSLLLREGFRIESELDKGTPP